jgi:hypothetical protein
VLVERFPYSVVYEVAGEVAFELVGRELLAEGEVDLLLRGGLGGTVWLGRCRRGGFLLPAVALCCHRTRGYAGRRRPFEEDGAPRDGRARLIRYRGVPIA